MPKILLFIFNSSLGTFFSDKIILSSLLFSFCSSKLSFWLLISITFNSLISFDLFSEEIFWKILLSFLESIFLLTSSNDNSLIFGSFSEINSFIFKFSLSFSFWVKSNCFSSNKTSLFSLIFDKNLFWDLLLTFSSWFSFLDLFSSFSTRLFFISIFISSSFSLLFDISLFTDSFTCSFVLFSLLDICLSSFTSCCIFSSWIGILLILVFSSKTIFSTLLISSFFCSFSCFIFCSSTFWALLSFSSFFSLLFSIFIISTFELISFVLRFNSGFSFNSICSSSFLFSIFISLFFKFSILWISSSFWADSGIFISFLLFSAFISITSSFLSGEISLLFFSSNTISFLLRFSLSFSLEFSSSVLFFIIFSALIFWNILRFSFSWFSWSSSFNWFKTCNLLMLSVLPKNRLISPESLFSLLLCSLFASLGCSFKFDKNLLSSLIIFLFLISLFCGSLFILNNWWSSGSEFS